MVRRFAFVIFVVLLAGRATGNPNDTTAETNNSTESFKDPRESESDVETTDQAVRNILIDISNGLFDDNDAELISLIKRGMVEAANLNSETMKSSIEAGAKKAQKFVTETTAAYTAAIFRADTAEDAQETLMRFQDTVQKIVDYAKSLNFTTRSI